VETPAYRPRKKKRAHPRPSTAASARPWEEVKAIFGMSDGVLESRGGSASGIAKSIMERELGARNRLKKQVAHGVRQTKEINHYKAALQRFLTEEQVRQFWSVVAELREADRLEKPVENGA